MAVDVTEALKGSLGNLGGEFKSDRLAYLSLTSKNERELCGLLAHKHSAAIPYFDGIRKRCPISQDCITKGFERFHAATEKRARSNLRKVDEGQIHVGNAFNIDVSMYYWLVGVSNIVRE